MTSVLKLNLLNRLCFRSCFCVEALDKLFIVYVLVCKGQLMFYVLDLTL